jgi:hypothetical protein
MITKRDIPSFMLLVMAVCFFGLSICTAGFVAYGIIPETASAGWVTFGGFGAVIILIAVAAALIPEESKKEGSE